MDCPDSLWIVWTVCGLSGQFLDCPDSFWIVRTVSGLSREFLDYPDSFWIVRKVSGLSGQFLDYVDSFRKVWTVSCLSRQYPACFGINMNWKGQYLHHCKNFPAFCKNFTNSNADTLTRFFLTLAKIMHIETLSKKSNINQCAINHVNCYIMVVANLWKLQNFAVYIIMQSAKIVRLLIETLVKSHILERYIGDIRQTKLLAWTFVWAGTVCYPFTVLWGTYCSAHYISLYSLHY